MTLDQICQMTKKASTLNALHACREGHPLNKFTDKPFWNAAVVASQDRNINMTALQWLTDQAKIKGQLP